MDGVVIKQQGQSLHTLAEVPLGNVSIDKIGFFSILCQTAESQSTRARVYMSFEGPHREKVSVYFHKTNTVI